MAGRTAESECLSISLKSLLTNLLQTMLYTMPHFLSVCLSEGIRDELSHIGLLFLLKLSKQPLLEVSLDDGEDRLYAVELRTVRDVEDWHHAECLHGLRGVLGRVDLEVVQEEGEGLVVVLAMEQIEELNELLGGDGAVLAEQLLNPALMADRGNHGLGLEAVGLLGDADVAVFGIPCVSGKGRESEDSLIKVEELETQGQSFIQASNHLLEAVTVVAAVNLNGRLCAPNALKGDFELLVYPPDEGGRDMELGELPMEHDRPLLQREVGPVVKGAVCCEELDVLDCELSPLATSLSLR